MDKTKKMLRVEEQLGQKLEEALPVMCSELGLTETANRLGISKAVLGYWLIKLGINVRRAYLGRSENSQV